MAHPAPHAHSHLHWHRTKAASLLLLVIISFIPGLVAGIVRGDGAGGAAIYGAVGMLMLAITTGPRTVLLCAVPYGIAAGLIVIAADRPLLAFAVMGAVTAAAASMSRVGHAPAYTQMSIMLAFLLADPPKVSTTWNPLWVGVLVTLGSCWMAVVSRVVLKGKAPSRSVQLSRARSLTYAGILGLIVGLASAAMVGQQWGHGGAWFVMTLILVAKPDLDDAWQRTLQRGLGTILGIVIAVLLGLLIPWPWLAYVCSVALIYVALRVYVDLQRPYWQFVLFLTPAIVLLEGTATSVTETAGARLVATFGAIGISLIVVLALRALPTPLASHHHDSTSESSPGGTAGPTAGTSS